ncbi:MAG: 50S ribosomal protein L22 [Ignavibacteria bacterium]|nr:50S ribosomal protein L22 [Ignavibacteria bacterium]MBL7992237.1 50S ribosomal protein L22 [Candidatus Kapabacteria bacterium]
MQKFEAKATKRFLPGSPRKMRLVIDMIRGKSVAEAMSLLKFNPKHAARDAEFVLRSAYANLEDKHQNARFDMEGATVTGAFVDGGPMLRRISPAPMGRAYRIRKRMNHLTIVVQSVS